MSVYFIECQGKVKIGNSNKPYKRLSALQSGNPFELSVLAIMPGSPATEHELHSVFQRFHHRNEWYRLEGELESFVDTVASTFSEYKKQWRLSP